MANGVLENNRLPQYCKNLVTKFWQFNDNFSYNTVSGGSNGVANNNQERVYEGNKSLLVTFTGTGEYRFNTGGTETEFVIPRDGWYLFSYAFWKENTDASVDYSIQFYADGVADSDKLIQQTLHNTNGFIDNQWNTYFQFIYFNENDVVSADWSVQASEFSGTKVYLDAVMVNLNDRNLTIPPIYQKPEPTIIEVEEVIDLGSISSNSWVEHEVTMQGVLEGDFITIAYPIELIDLGLVVAVPTVSEPNKIKFLVHNHSGGAINPASGSYKFLAYRQ
jgi:hypothetical protein